MPSEPFNDEKRAWVLTTPSDLKLGSTAPGFTLLLSSHAVTPVPLAAALAELVLPADVLLICSFGRKITARAIQHICSQRKCVGVKNKPPPGLATCSGQVQRSRFLPAAAVCATNRLPAGQPTCRHCSKPSLSQAFPSPNPPFSVRCQGSEAGRVYRAALSAGAEPTQYREEAIHEGFIFSSFFLMTL